MKTLVVITTYNRNYALLNLTEKLLDESDADIVVFDDKSENVMKVGNKRVTQITNPTHRGKAGFWQTYNDIFAYCKEHEYDYYIILPDDIELCPNFIEKAIRAYQQSDCICLSPLLTNRSVCDGISRWGQKPIVAHNSYYETGYFDCCGVMRRDFFEALNWRMEPITPSSNPNMSSGVGRQITTRLQKLGKKMCHVKRTLISTAEVPSEMNPEERKRTPMHADYHDNKNCVDVYMASLWRDGHVIKTSKSLLAQPELKTLTVCCNNYTDEQYEYVRENLPDSVKLLRTNNEKGSNEKMRYMWSGDAKYIAMADDDLIYPEDYLFKMIHGCNIYNAAVSLHGGIFKKFPLERYYSGRHMISWNANIQDDVPVDVTGNGFVLFKREWFTQDELKEIYETAPTVSMDDIIMSCMFKKKGIPMIVLKHRANYASHKKIEKDDLYVFDMYKNNDDFQVQYINDRVDASTLVPIYAPVTREHKIVRKYQKRYPQADVYIQNGLLCIKKGNSLKQYNI